MDNTNMDALLLRVKEEEDHWQQSQDHEVELFQTLRLQVEDLQRRLEEKDNKLIMASKVIRALKFEVQTLQQQLEQHRRKCHGDLNGQRGWPFQYGRGNDITTMPCVQAESVPSDCRASEPRSQDVTSQSSEPFFRVVEIEDFGMPPNVVLSCTAEGDPTNFWMSPVDDNLTPPQDLEDDPADSPVTLGYRTLSKVKSQQVPKLPVLSVMLQDCRDLLGPDGVLKMEFEEGEDADDGDDLCYEDDEDDSDYDPKSDGFSPCSENKEVLSPAEELIAEPAGDQRRQKRGGTRIRTKTTLDKSHNKYRKCGKTFSYPSQKLSVRKGGYARIKSITTAAPYDSSTVSPHENTSSNSAKTVSPQEEDNPANTRSEPYKAKAADLIQHSAVHPRRTSDIMEYYVPYECDVCGRTLSNKTNLAVHKRTHTGEKPYGCTECGQTFRASNSLRRHQRRQHLQTALPRRKRGRPKKVADDLRDSLRDYLHSGKPYACTQCDKTFKYRGSFLTHKAWHIGEKHHACTQCGKTFRFLSNLRDHLKKCHAQKRPSTESPNTGSCQEIGKSSTQSSSLNQNPTEKAPTTSIPESTSTDSCNTGSHQEVEGNDHAIATPEPCKNNHTAQAKCKKLHSLKTGAKPAGLIQHPTVHPNGTYGEKGNNKRRYVPLECDVCGLMLANKRNLIVHKRIHTGEKPYVCTQCGKAFRSSSSFRAHQKSRHLLDGHLQTTLPLGKRARPKKGTDHLRDALRDDLHSGERPYACTQCDKAFRSSSNLRQHQKRHHTQQRSSTESPNTGSSQEVGQASTHSNSLNQRPIDNPHGNTSTDYPDEEEGDNGITYEVPCECDICGKEFTKKRNLIIHKRMHTGEKPYACTQCGNTYRSKDALRFHQKRCHLQDRHLQTGLPLRKRGRPKKGTGHLRDALHDHLHSGKRQYSCTLCDKTFKYRGSFLTHKAWHTGKKHYSCTQCGKTFRSASALRGHQKFHNHLQEKPSGTEKRENWKCDVCGKILANSRNLRIHLTLHTGERQYACTLCDKTFMYRTSLQNHQKSRHLQERPSLEYRRYEVTLKCDICERVFSNKSSLIVHKRRHTGEKPYACTLCEKTFRHQGTLKLHHRLHTKERPYKCSDCPMAWNSLGELKNHIRRKHTGEKPYACPLCPKTFYTASERSCHKKSHLG